MNQELEQLNDWFRANRLCLNVKKKYILFRLTITFPRNVDEYIYMNGQEVIRIGNDQNEKSFKFLGLYLDETLSWKFHIQNVCSKISRSNYIINKGEKYSTQIQLKNLIFLSYSKLCKLWYHDMGMQLPYTKR